MEDTLKCFFTYLLHTVTPSFILAPAKHNPWIFIPPGWTESTGNEELDTLTCEHMWEANLGPFDLELFAKKVSHVLYWLVNHWPTVSGLFTHTPTSLLILDSEALITITQVLDHVFDNTRPRITVRIPRCL